MKSLSLLSTGLLLTLLLGCPPAALDDDDDDSAMGDDDDDDSAPLPIALEVELDDFPSNAALVGAEVSSSYDSGITDEFGETVVMVDPSGMAELGVVMEGYRDHLIYRTTAATDFETGYRLVSDETTTVLGGALGLDPSSFRGMLTVSTLEGTAGGSANRRLAGVHVEIDGGYTAAVVEDPASPLGISPGQTSADGGSNIVFIDVEPGTWALTVTAPEGYVCDEGTGVPVEVGAAWWTLITLYCNPA